MAGSQEVKRESTFVVGTAYVGESEKKRKVHGPLASMMVSGLCTTKRNTVLKPPNCGNKNKRERRRGSSGRRKSLQPKAPSRRGWRDRG